MNENSRNFPGNEDFEFPPGYRFRENEADLIINEEGEEDYLLPDWYPFRRSELYPGHDDCLPPF